MPDLTTAVDLLVNYPQQWAGAALLFFLAAGLPAWTPPNRTAVMPCSCGGDFETCRCGTPGGQNPRPFSGGAR